MAKDILRQNTSIVASILACAFALVALCMVWFGTEPQKDELMSVEIGVLTAVATVLIAWQLFTIFNLNRTVRDINARVDKKIQDAVDECRVPLEGEIAYIRADKWRLQGHKHKDVSAYELSYNLYLDALECFIKYPKAYYHEELLEYIKEIIETGQMNDWLCEEDKAKGVDIIAKTKANNRNEVLTLLLDINTNRPSIANIELQIVHDKNGNKHKLIFHNTGEETAYFLRFGFLRQSDADSVSIKYDNDSDFDEIKGDKRIVVSLTPNETFNHKVAIRVVYYSKGQVSEHTNYMLDFRSDSDPQILTTNISIESDDVCIYPNKIDIQKIKELV